MNANFALSFDFYEDWNCPVFITTNGTSSYFTINEKHVSKLHECKIVIYFFWQNIVSTFLPCQWTWIHLVNFWITMLSFPTMNTKYEFCSTKYNANIYACTYRLECLLSRKTTKRTQNNSGDFGHCAPLDAFVTPQPIMSIQELAYCPRKWQCSNCRLAESPPTYGKHAKSMVPTVLSVECRRAWMINVWYVK